MEENLDHYLKCFNNLPKESLECNICSRRKNKGCPKCGQELHKYLTVKHDDSDLEGAEESFECENCKHTELIWRK